MRTLFFVLIVFFWCRCCFPLAGEPGGRVRHFANGGRGLVRQSVADRTPAHPRRGRPQSRQQRRHLASRILSRIPLQLLPSVPFFLLSLLSTPKRKKRKKNRFSKSSFRVRSPSPESSTGKKKTIKKKKIRKKPGKITGFLSGGSLLKSTASSVSISRCTRPFH